MRISLVQMSVSDADVSANIRKVDQMIRAVVKRDSPELVLLPELWSTGFMGEEWEELADLETPKTLAYIEDLCDELGVSIGGSLITRNDDGNLVNRFSIITPGGGSVYYDKIHLFSPMEEQDYLVRGDERIHFAIDEDSVEIALSICYDLRFPAMYRTSAQEGVGVFLVTSAWPEPRCATLRTLAVARGVENQAFLVLCNRVGPSRDGNIFCGGSMVVSPIGEVLLDLGSEEGFGTITFNEKEALALRGLFNVLNDEVSGIDTPE